MWTTMNAVANTSLGLGMQALAKAVALVKKASLDTGLLPGNITSGRIALPKTGQKAPGLEPGDEWPFRRAGAV
jgi:hypothetical protein